MQEPNTENRIEQITARTFGLELEFADVEKAKVFLPDGYSWSKEEKITNTDKTNGTYSAKRGGEINTPPLSLCGSDLRTLRKVFESALDADGKVTWVSSIHVHIYVGDLGLDELKKFIYLSYYAAPYILEYGNVPEWNKVCFLMPSTTIADVEKVRSVNNLEALYTAYEDSTAKGYKRCLVNAISYFKRKTIEFRIFNGTRNFDEVMGAIMFAYRYVDYALAHSEEDYKALTTYEQFVKALKLRLPVPKPINPMIFSGDQRHPIESYISKRCDLNSKLISVLIENSPEEIALVNPYLFSLEVRLHSHKKLTVYNTNELNHLLWLVANGAQTIHFRGRADFLEPFNDGTPARNITLLMIYNRARKYFAENDYCRTHLDAIKECIEASVESMAKSSQILVDTLTSCKYVFGNLRDAIANEKFVFYQIDDYGKLRSTIYSLKKDSDYCDEWQAPAPMSYYELVETLPDDVTLALASYNEHLALPKLAQTGKTVFYCTKPQPQCKVSVKTDDKILSVDLPEPPDDLIIEDPKLLKICPVNPSAFGVLQRRYIHKVHKVMLPRFAYFVMYDKYVLGAFGFDEARRDHSKWGIWLVSDFCTNNNVPRLAKLILLCIKSKVAKKLLSRARMEETNICFTKVYTSKPVSMKYRGLFKKVKQDQPSNHLLYISDLGTEENYETIIQKYLKYVRG